MRRLMENGYYMDIKSQPTQPLGGDHMNDRRKPNALIHSKSPYLLQHAHNPVDWMQWSDAAFEKARREDKPIFLSIGYSIRNWGHIR